MNRRGKPRILVLTSTFPRWRGDSTPRFVHDLAMAISDAFEVTVLAPHHSGAAMKERMGPLDVHRFPYFLPTGLQRLCYGGGMLPNLSKSHLARAQVATFFVAQLAAARALIGEGRIDLVHAHWIVPQGLVAALATKRARLPLVISVHGSDVFALRGALVGHLERGLVRRAAAVTVNSEATRDEVLRRAPDALLRLLPMGIDESWLATDRSAEPHAKLLFVGRLSATKGVDLLIDAMPRVAAGLPDARLEIVGDGPLRPALEKRAELSGAGHRIIFRGALPHADIQGCYRDARAFVFPSRSEGQGLAVIEAMARGCPVVAARSGAIASLVGNDERGRLVSLGDASALADAVLEACRAPAETQRRADAARTFVAGRFTWTAIRPVLESIYRDALARHASVS